MKVCGIVAEYNPFHNGHLYQLAEAKKKTGADVLVVAMSGNFLQRGEPAIIDKWQRAQAALNHGADIVLEIPAAFSVQPADLFAKGAIELLELMGIDVLSFGSESGEGSDFLISAQVYLEKEQEIDALFQKEQQQKLTYAKNMSRLLSKHVPEIKLDLAQPNNILGFAYAKELQKKNCSIAIETVRRRSSHYHDQEIRVNEEIASATAIRKMLFSSDDWKDNQHLPFPEDTKVSLEHSKLIKWDDFFPYLKYRIMTTSLEELSHIYLMEQGFEYRVKALIKDAGNMHEFLTALKTKQLSWTRLQRLCFYILLDQSKEEMDKRTDQIDYIRLLGFNTSGQTYLREIKRELEIPLVTNISQKNNDLVGYDITVGEVYRLADQDSIKSQDYKRKPVKMD
ncbi:Predicted nucleotidyltransferase [Alkalibacterium subtropicum]|uniref:tRNA(Met) cytidine acetate ligase n=1 Tax=Alkalibacterium subtropicum TaxID=753702 RepID=A0A1I1EBS4_9LACT|nr:nucleotidyltransferase [Alkalibacterium subtropicum]SFB84584.1 Predicted nucleotidyltransferase [Alkalibacterium subtropicum]